MADVNHSGGNRTKERTGGQMWSLATEYRLGLDNLAEAIPLTIDAQYNVGFTWERQYGFRVTKKLGSRLWLGGAVEEAQTLNLGGHNLPTVVYQQAGNGSGLYNSTANYSFNYAPDLAPRLPTSRASGITSSSASAASSALAHSRTRNCRAELRLLAPSPRRPRAAV
jgi:hypothetical protein